jgi:cytidine deaminase
VERPTDDDLALVGAAVQALASPLAGRSRAAAAVRTSSGEVLRGVTLGGTCAEPVALGASLAEGELPVTIAVVQRGATARVVTPCTACRALLAAYAPAVRVLHVAGGLTVTPLSELPGC